MRAATLSFVLLPFALVALAEARDCGDKHWTQQSVKYLAPGVGKCATYADDDLGACMNPDCIDANSLCGKSIWVASADGSTRINNVQVVDGCPGITSCDSIWLTKAAYLAVGGSLESGNIYDQLQWGFQC